MTTNSQPAGRTAARLAALFLAAAGLAACSGDGPTGGVNGGSDLRCAGDINTDFLVDGGVGRGGIPALGVDGVPPPTFATVGSPELEFIRDSDRVVGFFLDGQPYAIPHNILWWHEIANFEESGRELAVTFCPITGTALGFERSSIGGNQLQVSGLLFQANLVMVDVGSGRENESLFPQMVGEAACTREGGSGELGVDLARFPVVEMTWRRWRTLYPSSLVVTNETGVSRDYEENPYGPDFSELDDGEFLGFPMPSYSRTFPATERMIGIPPADGEAARAFPFSELRGISGDAAVVEFTWQGEPAVVLWDERGAGGMAYHPRTTDGTAVQLTTDGDLIVDETTGTVFDEAGTATSGELEGSRLEAIAQAYTSFWGAWAAFFPGTEVWEAGSS